MTLKQLNSEKWDVELKHLSAFGWAMLLNASTHSCFRLFFFFHLHFITVFSFSFPEQSCFTKKVVSKQVMKREEGEYMERQKGRDGKCSVHACMCACTCVSVCMHVRKHARLCFCRCAFGCISRFTQAYSLYASIWAVMVIHMCMFLGVCIFKHL